MKRNPIDLEGQVAVVTGAAGGIGQAIVSTLRQQGATVIAADIQAPADAGNDFRFLDVRDVAAIRTLAAEVHREHGHLDIWVNNAGALARCPALDLQEESWNATIDVNLKSVVFGSQAAASVMKENGGGAIVNLSSYAGLKARPNCIDYASAKAAVDHATKCLAIEWGSLGIRVNAIAPGYIDTRMSAWMHDDPVIRDQYLSKTAVGRLGSPQEVAHGVLYLVSPMASYVTGHTLIIDGGVVHG